jgi:uncharacterized protein
MRSRHLTPLLLAALRDTPVVFLQGARQTGKSTLAQSLAELGHEASYLTLDDAGVLAAAEHDPAGFVRELEQPVILDEVQRVPELFLAIKHAIDRRRAPGRFLLTGSADALLLPRLAETLAGRMEILTLWPFSQGEIEGRFEAFVDGIFAASLPKWQPLDAGWRSIIDRIVLGGYPEVIMRRTTQRRRAWFGSYITTILQRDIRDMASIQRLSELPFLLRTLASRCGGLLNFSDLASGLGIPQTTLKRYMALLEATFLVQLVPAWASNLGVRLVKSPKLMLCDTGLLCSVLDLDADRLSRELPLGGRVLENFVAMELRKQSSWSERRPSLYHYRSHSQQEVDLVLEDAAGRAVGIEVKASATVASSDFKGLRHLSTLLGDRFVRGVLLYGGTEIVPFGKHLHAVPLSVLWAGQ